MGAPSFLGGGVGGEEEEEEEEEEEKERKQTVSCGYFYLETAHGLTQTTK